MERIAHDERVFVVEADGIPVDDVVAGLAAQAATRSGLIIVVFVASYPLNFASNELRVF